ncbi:MAG: 2-oxo acid dehydrogenase subunit E2 [Phycisphaeraceae bacterium]|nr:2-oxo acid dehydrogenase subunit E2 [Phycisphaeraceae bacterium]
MAGVKQPADKSHFILPDLGEGLAEAELISWKVKPGDAVKEQQTLAEMQTDKALVEVPSPWTGVISELCGKEGEVIKVGAVLVRYAVGGASAKSSAPLAGTQTKPSAAPASAAASSAAARASTGATHSATARSSAGSGGHSRGGAAVAASNGADEDQGTVVGSVSGTLSVSDRFARRTPESAAAETARGKALATPAVRRMAREMKVDISAVPATGRGGRVTASDVAAFARGGSTQERTAAVSARSSALAAALPPVDAQGVSQRIPFRGVRRKIAEALDRSVRTAVHFTATDEADVTALDGKRREYSRVLGGKLSMLPFVMAAVCRGLRLHPALNANVDDANAEILLKGVINLGVAVDTDAGLMVPVLRDADRLSIVELSDGVKRLAARCRDRSITREESLGGTFTISNVGSYGAMFATPIINYPEVAILAVGRAKERVLVKDGRFYAGLVLPLSISCDHRVVDGAEAARFLNTVVKLLEDPGDLLG